MKKEIEIKLKIDKETFDKFIKDKSKFQFEKTYGFFMNEYKNMEKGIFPRIKEVIEKDSRKAYVTVKVKNKKEENLGNLFIRDEHEFLLENVDDEKINGIRGIFFALEYPIEHIFEKRRYRLENINNCDFVVDELPFGYFIEIEGEEDNIEKSILELGLEKNERINKAYLKLWDEYKTQNNLTGECIFNTQ
jgi:hypothetical protein